MIENSETDPDDGPEAVVRDVVVAGVRGVSL
jgi:hypothetical protein